MVEKDEISSEELEFEGISDFKKAYKHAYGWLKDRKWSVAEDKYAEKVKGDEKEIEVEWSGSKKLTDYFKGKISVKWKLEKLKDVEVEMNGKRKQMQEFKAKIKIKGVLEKDYKSNWESGNAHKFMKEVYHKYVIPSRISEKEDAVGDTVNGLKEELKSFFDLTARK